MTLDDEFGEELSTRDLIKRQRELLESSRLEDTERAMSLGATLHDRLYRLSDFEIAKLLSEFCLEPFYYFSPELTICTHAKDRLFRGRQACHHEYQLQQLWRPATG
jgi:hypothetical protein